jgi:hypothetical protein
MIPSLYTTDLITWTSFLISLPYFIGLLILHNKQKKYYVNFFSHFEQNFAFFTHLFWAIASVLVIQYYYKLGDTCLYYSYGVEMRKLFSENREEFYKMWNGNLNWSTGRFMNLTAILNFLCFDSYLALMLFFFYFSYTGLLRLIMAFKIIYPDLDKRFSYLIFILPTLHFYGAIVLKDTLIIGCLGWLLYCLTMLLFNGKKKLLYFIIILSCCYLIAIVRNFILFSFLLTLPLLTLFYSIRVLVTSKTRTLKKILPHFYILFIISAIYFIGKSSIMSEFSDYILEAILEQQRGYELLGDEGGSTISFDVSSRDIESLGMLLKLAPQAFINGIFRPFPWDSKNIFTLLLSFETFTLFIWLIFLIIKKKVIYFFTEIINDNYLLACFLFVIIYGMLVGLTTLNLGTIVRYRIPLLPFLLILLYKVSISTKLKEELTKKMIF